MNIRSGAENRDRRRVSGRADQVEQSFHLWSREERGFRTWPLQAPQLSVKQEQVGASGGHEVGLWAVTQSIRPCHFAIGCRTECIIEVQCSSSERFSFPTLNCPITCLVDFLVPRASYMETKILHCSRGNSGRENMRTSLKTVTRQRAAAEVFWYLSLDWLHWTLTLAYRTEQHRHG